MMAVINEMMEEITSVESDEEEKENEPLGSEEEEEELEQEFFTKFDFLPFDSRFGEMENLIVADDQLINLEVLKSQLTEMGVQEKCTYCVNGQDAMLQMKRCEL